MPQPSWMCRFNDCERYWVRTKIWRAPELTQLLKEKFLTAKKEARLAIVPILTALEAGAIPTLLEILKTSDDQWVRKNACEVLIQIGPVAAAHLLMELEEQQISVETICNILRVLGEIKTQQWKLSLTKLLKSYNSHEDPKLRELLIRLRDHEVYHADVFSDLLKEE